MSEAVLDNPTSFDRPRQMCGREASAVLRLRLTDFRSYGAARLELEPLPVVLTGANGAGKTNLLESVSLLVPGRGLRGARLAELARRESGEDASDRAWAVAARVATPTGAVDIGTGRDPAAGGSERRAVRVDGTPARGQAALADYLSAVWLVPQMDRLFVEGTPGRRRFLDRLVFGFDPAHAGRVAGYENAMRQRARLLRDGSTDATWLGALEEAMAARGVAIAAARREMARRLNAASRDGIGPFPAARVRSCGTVENWLDEMPALAAEDKLRDALASERGRDAEAGSTGIGPHRSDFEVHELARGLPAAQCSTGEQKALLISIVLATARLQAQERGAAPLVLLDEVAAHLDAGRREALFEEICALGAQAWLTGTDRDIFAPLSGRAQFFTVSASRLIPQ